MTDPFDDAKRALEGVPAPDVWAEAERRADADTDAGTVVALAPEPAAPRHRGRWLAVAAAAVLVVGGTVVALSGDDEPVDTGTGSDATDDTAVDPVPELNVYQAEGACKLGIVGEPLPEPATVSSVDADRPANAGTLVEGSLNATQTYAVQVPGQVVRDLVGERVEDVELGRGQAAAWFQADAVQVRWFTGSLEPCESFTVTVTGGTEDGNRHAAVDLAERVLLPSEVAARESQPTPGANPLAGTAWQLERSTMGGEATEGPGSVFTFTDVQVEWSDGCNRGFASYTYANDTLLLDAIGTTDVLCEPNPTSEAINAVMTAGGVAAIFDGDQLVLRTLEGELVLRPRAGDAGEDPPDDAAESETPVEEPATTTSVVSSTGAGDLSGLWEIVELSGGTALPAGELLVELSNDTVSWTDGCTGRFGEVTFHADGSFTLADIVGTKPACPADPGRDLINAVFAAELVEVAMDGDRVELVAGDHVIVLRRP